MPDFSLIGGGNKVATVGADTANSKLTTVAGGTSNSEGSWTELVASTSYKADFLQVIIYGSAGNTRQELIDIGIGSSGSEQIVVENIIHSGRTRDLTGTIFSVPLTISTGTRIAARVQQWHSVSENFNIGIILGVGTLSGLAGLADVHSYGDVGSATTGTTVDPGSTANTKGSWTEIVSSTAHPIKAIAMGLSNDASNVGSAAEWLFDIGIGGSGSEVVIAPNIYGQRNENENHNSLPLQFVPVNIPAGSRLAVRSQCNITNATDRVIDVILYGAH